MGRETSLFFSHIAILSASVSLALSLPCSHVPFISVSFLRALLSYMFLFVSQRASLSFSTPILVSRNVLGRSVCFSFVVLLASPVPCKAHAISHQHSYGSSSPALHRWSPPFARIPYPLRIQQLYPPWTLLCTRVASRQPDRTFARRDFPLYLSTPP